MAATGTRAPPGMPMDVYRTEDGSCHLEVGLPGVDPDSVEVTVEHSTLTRSGPNALRTTARATRLLSVYTSRTVRDRLAKSKWRARTPRP